MAKLSAVSFDATVRHQVFLERLKADQVKKLSPFLVKIRREIESKLGRAPLTKFSRARLGRLLADVNLLMDKHLGQYQKQLTLDLRILAGQEAAFEAEALTLAVKNPSFEAVIPTANQAAAAAFSAPLSVRGAQGGKLLTPFLKDWTRVQKATISGIIRQGAFEGQTNALILRNVASTGIAKMDRQGAAVVQTAIQHISSVARQETYLQNDDLVKAYEWVSTLDEKTSEICQGLSGRTWPVGEGPLPPAHINCRSSTVPVLDEGFDFLKTGGTQSAKFGPVSSDETYFSWLKKQPAAFQNQAIGPVRGKLLRSGGLSADEFQALRLNKNFQPLSLKRMQELQPLAFEKAGISINPKTGRVFTPPE